MQHPTKEYWVHKAKAAGLVTGGSALATIFFGLLKIGPEACGSLSVLGLVLFMVGLLFTMRNPSRGVAISVVGLGVLAGTTIGIVLLQAVGWW